MSYLTGEKYRSQGYEKANLKDYLSVASMSHHSIETLHDLHDKLMVARRGDSIEESLARILSSWSFGLGIMPNWLGLKEVDFEDMMQHHFPGFDHAQITKPDRKLDLSRGVEIDDLRKLLIENRSGLSNSEFWMVEILVAGCMGSNHLWEDLGLWSRSDLSRLMRENFMPLAIRNSRDMKWKKFLYKQLCESEGIYICRAPSCEVCVDYNICFGHDE